MTQTLRPYKYVKALYIEIKGNIERLFYSKYLEAELNDLGVRLTDLEYGLTDLGAGLTDLEAGLIDLKAGLTDLET